MPFHELRIAVRHLLKAPGFTATAVLMLALGIGATTAIFSVVEGVLLRPLPFPHPEQLVAVADILLGANLGGNGEAGVTPLDIKAYTRDTHSFESLGGYTQNSYELSGAGEPAQVNGSRLSGGVFPALGIAPLMGRFFTAKEDEQKEQVAVISYSLWQNRLHGDARVLGSKILLDRKPYVVVGVMPRNFEFPLVPGHLNSSELWVPMSFTEQELSTAGAAGWNFNMVGRLKPGIMAAQAENDAERVAEETMRNYPAFMASIRIRAVVRSLHEETVEQARQLVHVLFLAIVVVLLIACANLAGLLLVRAIQRRREIAVRLALGARAGTLLRQQILESLVLSVSGGLLGLGLAALALRVGVSRLPETLPRLDEIALDWQVVGFAFLLAVLTGMVCGLAPAFAALRTSVNETLKEGGRTGTQGSGHAQLRSALVVAEIAIALVLLVASGLLLRSFEKMRAVDLGFRPDHVLVANYSLPRQQYATQTAVDEFNSELIRKLQQAPGVRSVGLTDFLPAWGRTSSTAFVVEGYVPAQGAMDLATWVQVRGDYLQAMGIPLLSGRRFTPADTENTQLVVIVNHKLAEHYWPGADPIGKRMRIGTPETPTPWVTIVGEVADVKEDSPDIPGKEQFYQPIDQVEKSVGSLGSPTDLNGNGGYVALRTAMEPEQMENVLRATVRAIDAQLPLTQVQTMERTVSDSEAPRRFNTVLISSFAIAAVLLAALGIYSLLAFSAALREQEMAIRIALGSQRAGILGLVFRSAAKLALLGCGLGLLAAAAASQLLQSLVFGVSPFDPLVLALAAVSVLMLALVASLLPARRAAAIDPMKALRTD
ncbi:MAG TPA: ABC transporter permease [Candidatus Sulfotelmatobacter sp.]|nr:ABC transporter permease [Candidatus Sulfotelmatobacter sp.]